jgi:hypothetical protein
VALDNAHDSVGEKVIAGTDHHGDQEDDGDFDEECRDREPDPA